jgi:predicted dinucleotide-binding enzyme
MSLKTAQDNQTTYRQKKTQKTRKKGSSHMNIGIIGSGNIGANAARLFAKAGHQVAIANSRGPETLEGVVEKIGPNVRATTVEEAATFGELAMEAIPFGRYEELPREALSGRIVVSASNHYPGRDGALDLGGLAQTEALARHLSGSRVVKAFNTIYHERLANEGRPGCNPSAVLRSRT